jgi:hypothetical protein
MWSVKSLPRNNAFAVSGAIIRSVLGCLLAAAMLPASAQGRDDRLLLSVEGALGTPAAQDRLDDTVQFFWGEQHYPEPLEVYEIRTAPRKTYALNKSDLEACDWVFLSAVVALRDRARELGANAVVNIKSMYKNREFRSETEYECRAGYFTARVTLEGTMVKLPPPGPTAVVPRY